MEASKNHEFCIKNKDLKLKTRNCILKMMSFADEQSFYEMAAVDFNKESALFPVKNHNFTYRIHQF